MQNGPSISLWLTLFGVVAGFLSTFWSFGYTRLSKRLYRYLSTGPDDSSKRVKKADVLNTLMRGSWINVIGLGSTLLGLQATVGLLVAKTLTNATANPFLAGGAGSYNPVLALDVFLVQVRSTIQGVLVFADLDCNFCLFVERFYDVCHNAEKVEFQLAYIASQAVTELVIMKPRPFVNCQCSIHKLQLFSDTRLHPQMAHSSQLQLMALTQSTATIFWHTC